METPLRFGKYLDQVDILTCATAHAHQAPSLKGAIALSLIMPREKNLLFLLLTTTTSRAKARRIAAAVVIPLRCAMSFRASSISSDKSIVCLGMTLIGTKG